MKSIVVIPAWRRPEMLDVALSYIQRANDANQNFYCLQFEFESDPENTNIYLKHDDHLKPGLHIGPEWLEKKIGIGNSFNVLRGLERGLFEAEFWGASIIHLIEEDVWVAKDYFDAAEKLHKQFHPWAVSLCRNQHRRIDPIQNPTLVYKSHDYQSLGVSFSLDSVREILVHNTPEYFEDMTGYLRMMFPNSRYGSLFTEQDGLIQRIIEKNRYSVLYSNVARAQHCGYYSYHRTGKEPQGTLEEKITQLETMGETEMNGRSVYKDIRFCNLLQDHNIQEFYLDEI